MNNNNSVNGVTFGFGKANTENDKQTEEVSPVKESTATITEQPVETYSDENEEFTDVRTVTISLVKNYSLYRKANDRVLPKRRDYIGSSVSSSRVLAANKEEVETYFPNLIGVAPNNSDFITRVKQYLNNIRIPVDELGKQFDISFRYYKKSDYYKVKKEEDAIEKEYQKANRQDITILKQALQMKINRLNTLEGSKCKMGYPINLEDYLMYRHCLLYKDVAKDMALINSDPTIRFYFKDDQKEVEKLKKFRLEVNKAKTNYVSCLADDDLFDAIYIQYCNLNGLPILSSLAEDKLNREIKLDKFSSEEPVKFNKFFNNRDVRLMATIERLIAHGELVRSDYNQNISTNEGILIGANMNEAVIWFKNPENASVVNAYHNKLKNI